MTEKTDSFNNSFNGDFCEHLEYHLCRTFKNVESKESRDFWCDGVSKAPFYNADVNRNYLSIENILKTKEIVTAAWMGESGQDQYEMRLKLGSKSLSNYSQGLSLIDCLPGNKSMKWITLDVENKKIELRLK